MPGMTWFTPTTGSKGTVRLAHPLTPRDLGVLGLPENTPTAVGSVIEVETWQAQSLRTAGLLQGSGDGAVTPPTSGGGTGGTVDPTYAGLRVIYGPPVLPPAADNPNTLYCALPAPVAT